MIALKVSTDHVVTITYRILDPDGQVIDQRTPDEPYQYMQGRGQIVGPVERILEGQTPGFSAEVFVSPREGYGIYDPSLVADIARDQFPKNVELKIGMKFNTAGPSGDPMTVRVIEFNNKVATVDGNHPLAGIDLTFEVKLLDVREATSSEIEIGRPDVPVLAPGSESIH
jgi:FKBP-type peptidyl-prolyl cis-trans isomerase SlyD